MSTPTCTECGRVRNPKFHMCPKVLPNQHPLAQVAELLADDFRRLERDPHVEPIAWITQHGELFCAACVQPTLAQRDDWLGIAPDAPGNPEPCDLCGNEVSTC